MVVMVECVCVSLESRADHGECLKTQERLYLRSLSRRRHRRTRLAAGGGGRGGGGPILSAGFISSCLSLVHPQSSSRNSSRG